MKNIKNLRFINHNTMNLFNGLNIKNVMVLSFLMLSLISIAQEQTALVHPNTIKGVLYNTKTGQRLEGASISLECALVKVTTLTDENGYFAIQGASGSCFKITISMPGFEDKVLENVNNILEAEYFIGLDENKVRQVIR
ncbi:MAG: carboxypeptidase regulatory-like domain-containing protein [Saprospiraceae bacterium]|nr:carboxypeptidase regulatory-like domain-containing protein [Saprospiraceae bacterium]